MGNRMIRKEQREPSHIRSSELHRDLERANLHRQSSLSDNDGPPPHHTSRGMSPPPDQHHGFAFLSYFSVSWTPCDNLLSV